MDLIGNSAVTIRDYGTIVHKRKLVLELTQRGFPTNRPPRWLALYGYLQDCKKTSHLAQELVLDTNKISTPFSPHPSSRIKKGEIEENASYYLLSAKKSSQLCKLQERFSLRNEHILVAPNNFPPFPPNPVSSSSRRTCNNGIDVSVVEA